MWALAASAGVAALLVASEPAFVALKLAGAAYLVYLGGQALLAAVRRRPPPAHEPRARPAGHELRQGLLSNLGNPKMAVFFSSLLPQFGDSFAALLGLGLLFCALTLTWLTRLRDRRRPRRRRAAPPARAPDDRRGHRHRARRARPAPGGDRSLTRALLAEPGGELVSLRSARPRRAA